MAYFSHSTCLVSKALFYRQHKEPDMMPDQDETLAVGNRYRNYYSPCFMQIFPNCPVKRNYRTKEKTVVDFIKTHYPTHYPT